MKRRKMRLRMLLLPLWVAAMLLQVTVLAAGNSCSVNIPVEVQVEGTDVPSGVDYTVRISPVDSANPMPEADTVTITDGGTGSFGPITYTSVGDYEYKIVQEPGDVEGMTYDETSYIVTVRVTNGADGLVGEMWIRLEDQDEKPDSVLFVNTYDKEPEPDPEYDPVLVDPPVSKKVVDESGKQVDDDTTFTFQMTAQDSSYPMPSGSSNGTKRATVVGSGAVEFGIMKFTEPGTYSYKLSEIGNSADSTHTYSTDVYTIEFTVTKGEGKLEAKQKIIKNSSTEVAKAEFVNIKKDDTYDPVLVDPPVSKRVVDKNGNKVSDNTTFNFQMTALDKDNPMPPGSSNGIKRASVVGSGAVEFGIMKFTEPGTYSYKLSEIGNSADTTHTYSTDVYTIQFTVTKGEKKLEAAQKIIKNNSATVSEAVFVNIKKDKTPTPDPNPTPTPTPTPTPNPTPSNPVSLITDSPKTGDETNLVLLFCLLGMSALGLILVGVLFFWNRRRERD